MEGGVARSGGHIPSVSLIPDHLDMNGPSSPSSSFNIPKKKISGGKFLQDKNPSQIVTQILTEPTSTQHSPNHYFVSMHKQHDKIPSLPTCWYYWSPVIFFLILGNGPPKRTTQTHSLVLSKCKNNRLHVQRFMLGKKMKEEMNWMWQKLVTWSQHTPGERLPVAMMKAMQGVKWNRTSNRSFAWGGAETKTAPLHFTKHGNKPQGLES